MILKTSITSKYHKGSIVTSVFANEVEKMEKKDVCKYSLKRSKKLKLLKTSVKLSSKGEATLVSFQPNGSDISFDELDMNCEYFLQHCLNQQFTCKKQKNHL